MNPPPRGWPRIASAVFYDDAAAAIDFLCGAFGFEVRIKVEGEGGQVRHSQLVFGDGMIMVSSSDSHPTQSDPIPRQSPKAAGGANTQAMCVCVDDVDAHCARAEAAGAHIAERPVTHDHGEDYWADRSYRAVDPEGHHWWFLQRVREQPEPK